MVGQVAGGGQVARDKIRVQRETGFGGARFINQGSVLELMKTTAVVTCNAPVNLRSGCLW